MFGTQSGYLCIASAKPNDKFLHHDYFEWPEQKRELQQHIEKIMYGRNVWFCAQLLTQPKRQKQYVDMCQQVWADLDDCAPDQIEPEPPIVIESSPDRFQAVWPLPFEVPAAVAEEYSKRLAYKYSDQGVDRSGWDLTQLLRVPYTHNQKYAEIPEVQVVRARPTRVPIEFFEELPPAGNSGDTILEAPVPEVEDDLDADEIIEEYKLRLDDRFWSLYRDTPDEDADWSRLLWRLLAYAFEAGMTREEVFAVSLDAECNKFKRDEVSPRLYLWADVLRADRYAKGKGGYTDAERESDRRKLLPDIVLEDDPKTHHSFIDEYSAWAAAQSDAPRQYHEVMGFVLLSAIMSRSVRIGTSIGKIIPNLWVMILADTTLTRKTTAMNLAMDLLEELEAMKDVVLATDGSVEGLLQGLSQRPGKPSIFLKDEVTGLIDSVVKKDYMAGMLENLTKLYDGKNLKRQLKKETINVSEPVFMFVGGGIKKKMMSILTEEHVTSGFIPRFLVVSAESDIDKMKPLGRRSEQDENVRDSLKHHLVLKLDQFDDTVMTVTAGGNTITRNIFEYDLTDEAWDRYNEIEKMLVQVGHESDIPEILTPVYDRMSKTLLKMATLIAADTCEGSPRDDIVEVEDINAAAVYIQRWMPHMLEVLRNIGKTDDEHKIERVYNYIVRNQGSPRAKVMRNMRLDSIQMSRIQNTLEQRGMITITQSGRTQHLWPT